MKRHSIITIALMALLVLVGSAALAAPGLMNYQGRLTDSGGNPITSTVNVTFTFWTLESGGSQIGAFSDTDSVTPDSDGIYSTLIGDDPSNLIPDPVFENDTVYLNVNVGGENLTPRKRITSAAFALNAPPHQYDAVVAPSGGDYTTIQAALTDGNKTIFVRNGTYTLASPITVSTSGTVIVGESRDGVIIDCNSTTNGIDVHGTHIDNAGTITINTGSSVVSGSGTSWSGTVSPGHYIQLGGHWYEIASVGGDTGLTLVDSYRGKSLFGVTYDIAALLKNVRLENLTVKNFNESLYGAIELWFVQDGVVRNCTLLGNISHGIYLWYADACVIEGNSCHSNSRGIYLQYSTNNTLSGNSCNNNSPFGIELEYSTNNLLSGNSCNNNDATGIFPCSYSNKNTLTGNSCNYNNAGIRLQDSCNNNALNGNSCNYNDNVGISLSMFCNNNSLSGNSCYNNDDFGIGVSSSNNNSLNGNSCNYNYNYGIVVTASNNNSLNGNTCSYNRATGVVLSSADENTVIGNNLNNNDDYGVLLGSAACDNNIVGMNILTGNGTAAGSDAGTNTMQKATNYPSGW